MASGILHSLARRGERMKMEIPSAMDFIKKLQADVRSKPFTTIEEAQAQNIMSELWCVEIIEALEKAEKYKWHDLKKNPDDLPGWSTSGYIACVQHEGDYIKFYKQAGYIADTFTYAYSDGQEMQDVIAWREIEPFEEVRE